MNVVHKIATAVDGIPKALNTIQHHLVSPRKKVIKQEFAFEKMIKELIDHQNELKIRRSDINLSSFDSYFRRILKGAGDKAPSSDGQSRPQSKDVNINILAAEESNEGMDTTPVGAAVFRNPGRNSRGAVQSQDHRDTFNKGGMFDAEPE